MRISRWMGGLLALLVAGSMAVGEAAADEKQADSCLRTKIWDGYGEGWAVRTATSATLAQGAHRVYLVTLYAGNEYKLQVCGDDAASNIDLIIHDTEGNEVARDETADREPVVLYKPALTETYYVVMYASGVEEGQSAGMAMAVTYR
ncbi:MAG: hypothetical protein ACI8S6_001903 [Myxococcota bacterium]|jgi:hypothetical protein